MPPDRAHLDTSTFGAAANAQHRDHSDAKHILEECKPDCVWCVPDLAIAEATFREYIDLWERNAVARGVTVIRTQTKNGAATLRKQLAAVGLHGTDIRHVFCALANECPTIVSADEDFINPKAKGMKRRKEGRIAPCAKLAAVLASVSVTILMPSDARHRYCTCA